MIEKNGIISQHPLVLVSQYFPLPWVITANGIALMITSAAFLFIPQVAEDAHE